MTNFSLGDVVALKTHPYDENITSIIIGGEPMFMSPLMIVTEILNESKTQFDEKTGHEISIKGNSQCKCIWYSTKSHQYEEAWVSSKTLKIIRHAKVNEVDNFFELVINQTITTRRYFNVAFATSDVELKKLKSSLSYTNGSVGSVEKKITTNALLSFVSPPMQILQIVEAKALEQKEPVYDQRTGLKKRHQPTHLAKCKWYNSHADKFSEKFLPIEALVILPNVSTDQLEDFTTKVTEKEFGRFKNSIIQYKELSSVSGLYFIKIYDYLTNEDKEINLSKHIDEFEDPGTLFLSEVPVFDFVDGEILPENYFIQQYKASIDMASERKSYVRFSYKDWNDKITTRTVKPIEESYLVLNVDEGGKQVAYLKAFCLTKNAVRTFRIDRMRYMQVLHLTFI